MKCNRCKQEEAQFHQKEYGCEMEKEIRFCERCLRQTLQHEASVPSKKAVEHLSMRNALIEDRQFSEHALQESLAFMLLFPQAFLSTFTSGDLPFDEKRWGKMVLEVQYHFYRLKLQSAQKNEDYDQATQYKEIMQRIIHSYRKQFSEKWGDL